MTMTMTTMAPPKCHRLWIGGSSGLTETYFNAFPAEKGWILLGLESKTPSWMPSDCLYWSIDVTEPRQVDQLLSRLQDYCLTQLVISVRPPLVTRHTYVESWKRASALLRGLERLLDFVVSDDSSTSFSGDSSRTTVVHLSSIASIDHIAQQHLRSETDSDPSSTDLRYPYDRFKRQTEEVVEKTCGAKPNIRWTNLRTGALFSDNVGCIQCSSLTLSSRTGPYLRQAIDCNSSRNVCHLIHLILLERQKTPLRPIYYYTRPLHMFEPQPYGEYLLAFQRASAIRFCVWLPMFVIAALRGPLHFAAGLLGFLIPYLESLDYLLQVTRHEHTFDNRLVKCDFEDLERKEETIEACFRRRREHLLGACGQDSPGTKKRS